MYEKKYHIERFNGDQQGRLSVSVLMQYLNDIMERNANSYGASADYHLKQNLAWVLTEYQLNIHQMPKVSNDVMVGTLPYSFKRMMGYRIYTVKDMAGEVLIEGRGKFMLIDMKSKQFVRPTPELLNLFTDAKQEPEALKFDKWPHDDKQERARMQIVVSHEDIDVNGHVNNACYGMYAYRGLPEDIGKDLVLDELLLKYKKETFVHDELSVVVYETAGGDYWVDMLKDEQVHAQVLFKTKKKSA